MNQSRYTVLIVGDNIKSVTLLRKSLELFTNEFKVFTSYPAGENEIEVAGAKPDIIILHFEDSVIKGVNALKWLKSNPSTSIIPILMTTDFLSSDVQKAITAGADDFIKKPVERIELMIRIKYLIQRQRLFIENQKQSDELIDITVSLEQINKKLEEQQQETNRQKKMAEKQKKLADDLLRNIFPFEIAEQLKLKGFAKPKHYRLVTVMFTDFVGFSELANKLSIHDLIKELSLYFEKFESISKAHYIEKIKTIGDSYMCAGGLPLRNRSNPIDMALAALEIQKFVKETNRIKQINNQQVWEIRLGIHTGEVIAGVIGKSKMAYDIWGDTVNTASRIETSGEMNRINISEATYKLINKYFDCTCRGEIDVRNKGRIQMYFLNGLREEYSSDEERIKPNSRFIKLLSEL